MTLLAGIYSRNKTVPVPPGAAAWMTENIGRTAGITQSFSRKHFVLIHYDIEAFRENGIVENGEKVTAITGDPLLALPTRSNLPREETIAEISRDIDGPAPALLSNCHGCYSLCRYNGEDHSLLLATDNLGVRPLYYYIDSDFIVFSSTLRLLEQLDSVSKSLLLPAIIEKRIFGVPLGEKTFYRDIKIMRGGQFLRAAGGKYAVTPYFRWDDIPTTSLAEYDEAQVLEACFQAFRTAVASRSWRGGAYFSCLSGGLDSRCVVTLLRSLGKKTIAFNFSQQDEKDESYAAHYAEEIGIDYYPHQRPASNWTWGGLMAKAITAIPPNKQKEMQYPHLVLTGDGGSVGMGHVYLDDTLIKLFQTARLPEAIRYFTHKRTFPKKILKKDLLQNAAKIPFESMQAELAELASPLTGREAYYFLLRNDQSRHLHAHFENIDLHKVELLCPFYDTRLLKTVAAAPIEPFLFHAFYQKWVHLFPEVFLKVPWQTYPNHEPCPVAHDDDHATQWERAAERRKFSVTLPALRRCLAAALSPRFPAAILRRSAVLLAVLLHITHVKDYEYLFDFVNEVHALNGKCNE